MHKAQAILCALLAAAFYAANVPFSKLLMEHVGPTMLAALLYLGAGLGVGLLSLARADRRSGADRLRRDDLPYVVGMVVLDIFAPIFLMLGIAYGSSSNASLLGSFEIVATTLIALLLFRERVSVRLWAAIALITLSSAVLSFEGMESLRLSYGSLFVILATCCWGLENNCTRRISERDTYQIVTVKGLLSGLGALVIALTVAHEQLPQPGYAAVTLLLGFVSYGLSIFLYVRAQSVLGAARTAAYYAINPFIGAFLSFVLLNDRLTVTYLAALALMVVGTAFVVLDTLEHSHEHEHTHLVTHTHDGTTHTHVVTHTHAHGHYVTERWHGHRHTKEELERLCRDQHVGLVHR